MNVNEAVNGANSPLNATLLAGLESLDRNDQVLFTQYTRFVLPLDGYIFWVKTLSTMTASGSFHQSTSRQQNDDETFDKNSIVFSAESDIDTFNDISPGVMWIGEYEGVQFTFSSRTALYKVAGIYHYSGDAVYPALQTQLIDNYSAFDSESVIVSNSLPLWLSLNAIMPIFPAMLSEQNQDPVYATVSIDPNSQMALQSAPYIDQWSNHWQLVQETVKFTIYGLRNYNAIEFQDYILKASLSGNFGIMNMPIIKDERRNQVELSALAMKKSFEITINYYQQNILNIAQKLITSAMLQAMNNSILVTTS